VSSYFPFPNSRLIRGFSRSLYPKIPEILLANPNLNLTSFVFGPSRQEIQFRDIFCRLNFLKKIGFVFFLGKKNKQTKTDIAFFFFKNNIIE